MFSRAIGTGVDTLVLWFLSRHIFPENYWATYLLSPFISFEVAVMSNFLLSYFWIWSSRVQEKNGRSFWRHFLGFNISSLVGFGVKMLFLLMFERLFGWSVVVCNLVALCISGGLNFLLSDTMVFRGHPPRPSHELLSLEEVATVSPLFRGRPGRMFARFVMRMCAIDRLNILYDSIFDKEGPAAAHKALQNIGCRYFVGNPERLGELPDGAFITISNHPYGGLDGVILLDMIGRRREDLKIMVNKILARIEPMRNHFITVTPTLSQRVEADATTLAGIRTALGHLRSGHPLALFPSGAVSDLHLLRGEVADREWQEGVVRLIQKAGVPIVPIHFEGRNSLFYYLLGVLDWRVRLLRLPREVLNKHRGRHRVNIGVTITVAEQQAAGSEKALSELLRQRVYGMPRAKEYSQLEELIRG